MMYPINIFSSDPTTDSIRPFMIFIPHKVKDNITKSLAYGVTKDMLVPKAPFVLPMPNGGLIDASTNQYSEEASGVGQMNQKFAGGVDAGIQGLSKGVITNGAAKMGRAPDPRLTQVYTGTTARSFTGEWQMIPQSFGEAVACAAILAYVKYCAAPDRASSNKIGVLLQPYVFKIMFSNPMIHLAMQFDQMAIESYSINYFANGYAASYSDMMPKHMSLTMTFKEFGIKTKKDWLPI